MGFSPCVSPIGPGSKSRRPLRQGPSSPASTMAVLWMLSSGSFLPVTANRPVLKQCFCPRAYKGGLIHYILWNKSLLKMRERAREAEWMKSLPGRLECSSLTPGQETGRRGGKGSERKEEQEEAGATSLHLRSTDGGEGLPVALTASLLTRGAAVHHMGFGLS